MGARRPVIGRWRTAAAISFVLAACLLTQGCKTSDNTGFAETDIAQARLTASSGETIVPRATRTAGSPASRESYAERLPRDSFADRYSALGYAPQTAREVVFAPQSVHESAFARRLETEISPDRPVRVPSTSYKVAALTPVMPSFSVVKEASTRLIGFDNSAFPYAGKDSRPGGRYSDNRVLVHVPAGFDVRKPGVIVVFFHGHGATLSRDVRDRQLLPRQITESGTNAVLVAPQLAYDAADSSAGKFWERDGLKRFMVEAADRLAAVYGDPRSVDAFNRMPVIIVSYSGGFETAASSLSVGGLGKRIIGVVLLDSLYGHVDKFAAWISRNRHAFFISSYTAHLKRREDDLAQALRAKGIPVQEELKGPLKPGTVAFLPTDGLRHRDFVTLAWTKSPVRDVLQRMAKR